MAGNRIDVHCHVPGNNRNFEERDTDVYFNPYDFSKEDEKNLEFVRSFIEIIGTYKYLGMMLAAQGAKIDARLEISADDYLKFLYNLLSTSDELDKIVLLAMDGVYRPNGIPDIQRTDLFVSNKYLTGRIEKLNEAFRQEGKPEKRFYFGASVNPNRADWKKELDFVIEETDAVLLKWIPSVQLIDPSDPKHEQFYDKLRENQMPLLCHVGPEHTFLQGKLEKNKPKDNFRNLQYPLDRKVKVIAAHCCLPVSPLEPNYFEEFRTFIEDNVQKGNKIWTDTSALSLTTRIHLLPKICREVPPERLVHGSDFPIPIDYGEGLPLFVKCLPADEYKKIVETKNPLDRDIRIKRACGFENSILSNAYDNNILRIK